MEQVSRARKCENLGSIIARFLRQTTSLRVRPPPDSVNLGTLSHLSFRRLQVDELKANNSASTWKLGHLCALTMTKFCLVGS